MRKQRMYPRIFIFWALHLVLAVVGALSMSLAGPVQAIFSPEAASLVSLAAGLATTGLYFFLLMRTSRRILCSRREGVAFGLLGALPLLLIIFSAVIYLRAVPYNTIGYSFILLPVMLPFTGWIEQVFPLLPYHILALTVPASFALAVIAGASNR